MIATSYDKNWLQIDRPQPLADLFIENLIYDVLNNKIETDISDKIYDDFKQEMISWLNSNQLNRLIGFDQFNRVDIINGCTQFIDNLYMQGPVQVLKEDYRYHERLGLAEIRPLGSLKENTKLIISIPFPGLGDVHPSMDEILNECYDKNIDVHLDGAWVTCSRDLKIQINHEVIKSIGISLSKGTGLGWNRIGLRWTKENKSDSISLMNDFKMNNRALVIIGLHFLRHLPPDHLWTTHSSRYYKICNDFDLYPTKSIHIALRNNRPVGISPLIRYLENAGIA